MPTLPAHPHPPKLPQSPAPAPPPPSTSTRATPNFMTSLARGLIVIQAFTQQNPQMTISQLSVKTGLSRAAVRRCLYTLTKLGFAGAEDGQRYSLRPRMLTLSHTYTTSSNLSHRRPAHHRAPLRRLPRILLRRHPRRRRDRLHRPHPGSLPRHGRRPPHRLPPPRLLHLHGPRPARLPAPGPAGDLSRPRRAHTPHTTRTITTVEKLRLALRNVRRLGYAIVDQELEVGLRSLAVPVHAPNGRRRSHGQPLRKRAPGCPSFDMQTHYLSPLRHAATELASYLR